MLDFARTPMGKAFFEGHVPRLVKALEALVGARPVQSAITRADAMSNTLTPPEGDGWRAVNITAAGTGVLVLWERVKS